MKQIENKVSIVVPAFNCENYIGETLESIIAQTYTNWEAIVIDDCSSDNTSQIIRFYAEKDLRIKYHQLKVNSGAAIARNTAIDLADGEFIAFLDSDDIWLPEKLETQINFMKKFDFSFTCTNYNKINELGNDLGIVIKRKKEKSNYNDLLLQCPGNSTVIYNSKKLGKFKIPNIKKRNDYVMWLQVIKKSNFLYVINEVLGSHRIRTDSISSNKMSLIGYHWRVYREIENINIIKSSYLILYWCAATVFKLR